jgi:hypothetical protein
MQAADKVEEAEAETVREASLETEVDEQMRGDDTIGEDEAVQVGDVEAKTIDEAEEDVLPTEDDGALDDESETRAESADSTVTKETTPEA